MPRRRFRPERMVAKPSKADAVKSPDKRRRRSRWRQEHGGEGHPSHASVGEGMQEPAETRALALRGADFPERAVRGYFRCPGTGSMSRTTAKSPL